MSGVVRLNKDGCAWLDLTLTFGGNEISIVNEIHKREKKKWVTGFEPMTSGA